MGQERIVASPCRRAACFFCFFSSRSCLFEAVAQRHSRIQAITLSGPLHSLYFGEWNSSCCYLWPILEQQQHTIALRPHLTLDNLFLMWNVSAFCQVSRVRSTGSGRWLTCLFVFFPFCFALFILGNCESRLCLLFGQPIYALNSVSHCCSAAFLYKEP